MQDDIYVEEAKYFNTQIVVTIIFLLSVVVSILLIYDGKLDLEKKERLFTDEQADLISLINRALVVILVLIFLYANYRIIEIDHAKNVDDTYDRANLLPSWLAVAASILILKNVIDDYQRTKEFPISGIPFL